MCLAKFSAHDHLLKREHKKRHLRSVQQQISPRIWKSCRVRSVPQFWMRYQVRPCISGSPGDYSHNLSRCSWCSLASRVECRLHYCCSSSPSPIDKDEGRREGRKGLLTLNAEASRPIGRKVIRQFSMANVTGWAYAAPPAPALYLGHMYVTMYRLFRNKSKLILAPVGVTWSALYG